MAQRIVDGAIGAGKSYYVIHHIITNYFRWDDVSDTFVPKDDELVIFTNIDGCKLGNDLNQAVIDAGGLNPFFTVDYQKSFLAGKRCIYVIDEAQGPNYFHRKYYDVQVFYLFQYSRHLGIDFYLITQDVKSLAKEISILPEYVVHAVSRTNSMRGVFKYKFLTGTECFKTKTLKPEKRIFAYYKSMDQAETEKITSAPLRYMMICAILLVCAVVALKTFVYFLVPRQATASIKSKPIQPVKAPVQNPLFQAPPVGWAPSQPKSMLPPAPKLVISTDHKPIHSVKVANDFKHSYEKDAQIKESLPMITGIAGAGETVLVTIQDRGVIELFGYKFNDGAICRDDKCYRIGDLLPHKI